MKPFYLLCLPVVALVTSTVSTGHQDTRLEFHEGDIKGLPASFSPAKFDVENLCLAIGGKELVFPEGLRSVLMKIVDGAPLPANRKMKTKQWEYRFAASWYHDAPAGVLPPYILIEIQPNVDNARFEVLVDMVNLKILRAEIFVVGIGAVQIDLDGVADQSDRCEQAVPPKSDRAGG